MTLICQILFFCRLHIVSAQPGAFIKPIWTRSKERRMRYGDYKNPCCQDNRIQKCKLHAKQVWTTEVIERDKMFLEKLGVLLSGFQDIRQQNIRQYTRTKQFLPGCICHDPFTRADFPAFSARMVHILFSSSQIAININCLRLAPVGAKPASTGCRTPLPTHALRSQAVPGSSIIARSHAFRVIFCLSSTL